MTEAVARLAAYEREARWLFHGSPERLTRLAPRQAYTWVDRRRIADGTPAVFASHLAAVAIFMAVMPGAIGDHGTFGYEAVAGGVELTATSLAGIAGARGWVHVVRRDGFAPSDALDWRCACEVAPWAILEVTGADLPPVRLVAQ